MAVVRTCEEEHTQAGDGFEAAAPTRGAGPLLPKQMRQEAPKKMRRAADIRQCFLRHGGGTDLLAQEHNDSGRLAPQTRAFERLARIEVQPNTLKSRSARSAERFGGAVPAGRDLQVGTAASPM